ncbi:hypothetical protein B0J11DRAFT_528203 [Dendryphion nanum]|uniref:Uncharacterized protein n=1 Tax=Dendryphion nanum TaxID=256645 RepID=A0A9P9DUK6_9PLEO|nr:hypothetical protein B0J11DRAFT_528203 [Dendryphion nanum]
MCILYCTVLYPITGRKDTSDTARPIDDGRLMCFQRACQGVLIMYSFPAWAKPPSLSDATHFATNASISNRSATRRTTAQEDREISTGCKQVLVQSASAATSGEGRSRFLRYTLLSGNKGEMCRSRPTDGRNGQWSMVAGFVAFESAISDREAKLEPCWREREHLERRWLRASAGRPRAVSRAVQGSHGSHGFHGWQLFCAFTNSIGLILSKSAAIVGRSLRRLPAPHLPARRIVTSWGLDRPAKRKTHDARRTWPAARHEN